MGFLRYVQTTLEGLVNEMLSFVLPCIYVPGRPQGLSWKFEEQREIREWPIVYGSVEEGFGQGRHVGILYLTPRPPPLPLKTPFERSSLPAQPPERCTDSLQQL